VTLDSQQGCGLQVGDHHDLLTDQLLRGVVLGYTRDYLALTELTEVDLESVQLL
jgi:hypothetical protein